MAELRFDSASVFRAQVVITTMYWDMPEVKRSEVVM